MKTLNVALSGAQVNELFKAEAILLGSEDAVPCGRVEALFGERAVVTAKREAERYGCSGAYHNAYYIQDGRGVDYLTYRGFKAAASWHNAKILTENIMQRACEGR